MSIPNWIHNRFLALSDQYKTDLFGFEDAILTLKNRFGDSEDQVKVILSELRKNKLVEVTRSEEDSRKKLYKVLSPAEAVTNGRLNRGDIDRILKKAADLIRTRVDYSFILLLLFYKRFSDQWNVEYKKAYKEARSDGFTESEADTEAKKSAYHRINIPEEYLWENLRKDTQKISENLSLAVKTLADLNPTLKETFQQFDFSDFIRNPENSEILRQLVELFSSYSLENVSPDVLGDAYEWTLRLFAPQKAKEGEVYTPREVIQLMVELLDPKEQESVYDPACGSAGMLIAAYKHVEEKQTKQKADSLFLYGQEQNSKTLALAKMNLLIHDITNGILAFGDTLRFPKFKDGETIKRFSYVLANPPWNQDGYQEETLKTGEAWKDRFPFGFPTSQSADWAWVQHMYSSLKRDGKLAVVLDTGSVSRGSGKTNDKEKVIRNKFVDNDLVEAVILLPENLFYNTSAPGLILIVNKAKPDKRKNKILLINGSQQFEKGKPKNFLKEEHIKNITKLYQDFEEQEGVSKIITNNQAKEADYNLSPSRFVSAIKENNHRSINAILKDLEKTEGNSSTLNKKLNNIFSKIIK